jgi:hypothetical protein
VTFQHSKALSLLEWKLLVWLATPYGHHNDAYRAFRLIEGKARFHEEIKADAARSALGLIARGWTTKPDEFGNIWLNEDGLNAAKTLVKPAWEPPPPAPLEARDWDVLDELGARQAWDWVAPMDCGGTDGSHHSASLTRLTRHGFAECRKGGTDKVYCGSQIVREPRLFQAAKGSREFRITPEGIHALSGRSECGAKAPRLSRGECSLF